MQAEKIGNSSGKRGPRRAAPLIRGPAVGVASGLDVER
jgi:hypothetical protein